MCSSANIALGVVGPFLCTACGIRCAFRGLCLVCAVCIWLSVCCCRSSSRILNLTLLMMGYGTTHKFFGFVCAALPGLPSAHHTISSVWPESEDQKAKNLMGCLLLQELIPHLEPHPAGDGLWHCPQALWLCVEGPDAAAVPISQCICYSDE